jgi:hypothetical protein
MLTSGAVPLHDNTCTNTAVGTQALLEHFNWELFDHSPYNHELTRSEKKWLGSLTLKNNHYVAKFTGGRLL